MTATAYRIYDLPWTPSPEDERRVRRVLGAALGIFIGLGVVIPLLPEREQCPGRAAGRARAGRRVSARATQAAAQA